MHSDSYYVPAALYINLQRQLKENPYRGEKNQGAYLFCPGTVMVKIILCGETLT